MRRNRSKGRKRLGHHLVQCDYSGWKCWDDEVIETWDGHIVHKKFFEERHPQDFVRGQADDQTVDPSRPEGALVETLSCNAEGRQGVAGLGTSGCAIAGLDLPNI